MAELRAAHLAALQRALPQLEEWAPRAADWGRRINAVASGGGTVLVAGNGGCDALADHFAAELIGRYEADRPPLRAINLHASSATTTALINDFGFSGGLERRVRAYGRRGDILFCMSTSGQSANLVQASECAARLGMSTWAIVGATGSPLAGAAQETIELRAARRTTIQELQLVLLHMMCDSVDEAATALRG